MANNENHFGLKIAITIYIWRERDLYLVANFTEHIEMRTSLILLINDTHLYH